MSLQNEETRGKVEAMLNAKDWPGLESILGEPLKFGTAGLRAEMGPGFNRMNSLTVIQASQGVCQYLLDSGNTDGGIVIGFDHRHNSRQFAELAAAVFLSKQIKVSFFPQFVPTPFIPFAVKTLNASAGIMITASHNPKQDNGYKLYWSNACQIISPHDKHIQLAIEKNQVPWCWDSKLVYSSPLVTDPTDYITNLYFDQISKIGMPRYRKSTVKIVYTAMHGVGYPFAQRAAACFKLLDLIPVDEQVLPDPEFPTVKYPNPEEGADSLNLAIRKADSVGAAVILANDPDADRLAVAEKLKSTNEWKIFTGNEMATVMGVFVFENYRKRCPSCDVSKLCMLASTVSSKFLKRMAEVEGFHFEETLTGFKWIGNKALDLQASGMTPIFCFEEAIGFMVDMIVPDKDGISALGVIGQLANHLYARGSSLHQYLESCYEKYGYHKSINSYYKSFDQQKTMQMFNAIRYGSSSATSKYPERIGENWKVTAVRDLTAAYDSEQPDKKPILPVSKSAQMITFKVQHIQDSQFTAVVTLRTSGTEPKIKYYTEICALRPKVEWSQVDTVLEDLVKAISSELYKPEVYGFKAKE